MDRVAQIEQIVSRGRDERGAIRPESVFELRGLKVPAAEIAKHFGVSRNAIYKILKARPDLLDQKLKAELMRLSPWKDVDEEHMKMAQRQYVTHHIEYMLTNGQGMEQYKRMRLRHFYKELGEPDLERVLTYDRDAPRNEWSSNGGWVYVPREGSDGDLIVRTSDGLTDEQKKIFVRPPNWESI